MRFLDNVSWGLVLIAAFGLGLAPFTPEPHLFEKARLLMAGELRAPVDIFDMVMHGAPWLLLLAKGLREMRRRGEKTGGEKTGSDQAE